MNLSGKTAAMIKDVSKPFIGQLFDNYFSIYPALQNITLHKNFDHKAI